MESSRRYSFGFVLCIIYVVLVFFEPQQFFEFLKSIRITYLFGIIVLFWSVVTSSLEIKKNLILSKMFWLIILFIAFCYFSLIFNNISIEI